MMESMLRRKTLLATLIIGGCTSSPREPEFPAPPSAPRGRVANKSIHNTVIALQRRGPITSVRFNYRGDHRRTDPANASMTYADWNRFVAIDDPAQLNELLEKLKSSHHAAGTGEPHGPVRATEKSFSLVFYVDGELVQGINLDTRRIDEQMGPDFNALFKKIDKMPREKWED
jgi:hypothetical protein